MTEQERMDISNGIWLCKTCHALVDSDTQRYTVELLHTWKRQAEEWTKKELEFKVGDSDRHTQALNNFLKELSSVDRSFEFVYYEMQLNEELERLVKKMEDIRRKIEDAKTVYDGCLAEIYEMQFQNMRSIFLDINNRIEYIRVQKYAIRVERESLEKDRGIIGFRIECKPNPIQRLRGSMEHMAYMLLDTWKMVEAAESGFAECDAKRKCIEHEMEQNLF